MPFLFTNIVENFFGKLIHSSIREVALGDVWEGYHLRMDRGYKLRAYCFSIGQLCSLVGYSLEIQVNKIFQRFKPLNKFFVILLLKGSKKICYSLLLVITGIFVFNLLHRYTETTFLSESFRESEAISTFAQLAIPLIFFLSSSEVMTELLKEYLEEYRKKHK